MTRGFDDEERGARNRRELFGARLVGKRGTYREIPKEQLVVPQEYQRGADDSEQRAIAANFNWAAFGVLLVALRDGLFYVFDGQQRHGAAILRPDITEPLPCMVYELGGSKEEAQAFLDVNVFRKVVSAVSKHAARLHADDPTAKFVESLIAQHGYELSTNTSGPGKIKCVALLTRWAKKDASVLQEAFPLVAAVTNGHGIQELLLDGICTAERTLRKKGESLLTPKVRRRLVDIGSERLIHRAKQAAQLYAKGGGKVWATGILMEYNKGLPKRNHLDLGDPESYEDDE